MAGAQNGKVAGQNREYMQLQLRLAKDALQEARALYEEEADLSFVMKNLYFTFLYPVLGLIRSSGVSVSMNSIALSLFEKEFVKKGSF